MVRHLATGERVGSTCVKHVGVVIDTVLEKFFIARRKIANFCCMPNQLLSECTRGRRWVPVVRLCRFVRLCVSLTMVMPFSPFHKLYLY